MSSPLLKKVLHKKRRRSRLVKFIEDPYKLYQLHTLLGEGAYGKVYLGLSLSDGKEYAIKIVHVTDDIVEVQKEINILKKCNNVFVVRYHDSFIHRKASDIWIILEYCHGGSVEDVIKILDRPLTEPEIRYILKDVLRGLQYLHENKRIHRDIKCGNILLTKKGVAKLTDFGVSIELTNSMSKRNSLIGTPYWMAPEVIREVRYDEKADIWSIGITVIEMAEKEPPLFRFQPMRALFIIPNRRPPTLQRPSDFSKDLQDFLSQCLKKEPHKRSSCKELLRHPFMIDTGPKRALPKDTGHPFINSLVCEVEKKLEAFGGDKQKYFQKMMKDSGGRRRGVSSSSSQSQYSSDSSDEDEESSKKKKKKKKKKNEKEGNFEDDEITRVTDSSDEDYSDYEDSSDDDDEDSDNSSLRKKKKNKKKRDSLDRKLEMFQSSEDEQSNNNNNNNSNGGGRKIVHHYSSPNSSPVVSSSNNEDEEEEEEESEDTSDYKTSGEESGEGDNNNNPSQRKKGGSSPPPPKKKKKKPGKPNNLPFSGSNNKFGGKARRRRRRVEEEEEEEDDVIENSGEISDLKLKVMEMEEELEDLRQEIKGKNRKISDLEKKVSRMRRSSNVKRKMENLSKMKENQKLVKKFLEIQLEFLEKNQSKKVKK